MDESHFGGTLRNSTKRIKSLQLVAAGALVLGTVAAASPTATASDSSTTAFSPRDAGWGWSDFQDVSIREKPTTTSRKLGTLKAGKHVYCYYDNCHGGTFNGGSYRCSNISPVEKTWHAVRWNGRKAWTASRCLEWGKAG